MWYSVLKALSHNYQLTTKALGQNPSIKEITMNRFIVMRSYTTFFYKVFGSQQRASRKIDENQLISTWKPVDFCLHYLFKIKPLLLG